LRPARERLQILRELATGNQGRITSINAVEGGNWKRLLREGEMERGKCHGSALWRGAIEVTDFAGEKLYHFRGLPSFSERNDERCYLGQPEEDLKDRERKEQRSYTSSTQDHVEILEDHNLFFPRILKTRTISATAARPPPPRRRPGPGP